MDNIKVLAQITPSAGVLTDFYVCPTATSAAISSIVVCNQNAATEIAFRISIAIGGSADTPAQYMYFDVPLIANDTFIATVGMTLAATDIIRVRTNNTVVSFQLFGVEVS